MVNINNLFSFKEIYNIGFNLYQSQKNLEEESPQIKNCEKGPLRLKFVALIFLSMSMDHISLIKGKHKKIAKGGPQKLYIWEGAIFVFISKGPGLIGLKVLHIFLN